VAVICAQLIGRLAVVGRIAVLANRTDAALVDQKNFVRLFGEAGIVSRHSGFLSGKEGLGFNSPDTLCGTYQI